MFNAKNSSYLLNCVTAGFPSLRLFILILFFQCFVLTVGGDQHDGNEQSIFQIASTAQASEACPWRICNPRTKSAAWPCHRATAPLPFSAMKDAMILSFHLLAVIARLLRPGGGRTLVAENLLLKQQLLLHK